MGPSLRFCAPLRFYALPAANTYRPVPTPNLNGPGRTSISDTKTYLWTFGFTPPEMPPRLHHGFLTSAFPSPSSGFAPLSESASSTRVAPNVCSPLPGPPTHPAHLPQRHLQSNIPSREPGRIRPSPVHLICFANSPRILSFPLISTRSSSTTPPFTSSHPLVARTS